MMKHYVRLACFVGGALFGSVGLAVRSDFERLRAPAGRFFIVLHPLGAV